MGKLFHQIKVITRLTELKIRAKRQQQQQQQPLFALHVYTLILLNRENKNIFLYLIKPGAERTLRF